MTEGSGGRQGATAVRGAGGAEPHQADDDDEDGDEGHDAAHDADDEGVHVVETRRRGAGGVLRPGSVVAVAPDAAAVPAVPVLARRV